MRKYSKKAKNSPKKSRRLTLVTVVVAMVVLAIGAVTVLSRQNAQVKESSTQEGTPQMTKKTDTNFITVEVAGQKVQVDPQTGQIKEPTPEEARQLAAGLKQLINKDSKDLVPVTEPDGSISIDLQGRFQHVTVAKVNENDSVSQSCVDNPKAAGEFFEIDSELIKTGKESTTPSTRVKATKKEK